MTVKTRGRCSAVLVSIDEIPRVTFCPQIELSAPRVATRDYQSRECAKTFCVLSSCLSLGRRPGFWAAVIASDAPEIMPLLAF